MKKLLAIAWVVVSILAVGHACAAITEGKEYTRLATPQPTTPGKIEIIEFFWYGCPHCYTIEPIIEAWAKKLPADVSVKREHIIWPGSSSLILQAKIYYTLAAMGLADTYQLATFKAIQRDQIDLRQEDILLDWVSKQGIDSNKFKATYHSFTVQSQPPRLLNLTKNYQIKAVPAFVVNGKYLTSPAQSGKETNSITQVLDELIALERKKT